MSRFIRIGHNYVNGKSIMRVYNRGRDVFVVLNERETIYSNSFCYHRSRELKVRHDDEDAANNYMKELVLTTETLYPIFGG